MPYQGAAFLFVLGLGIATVAILYLLREQERLEQPYGNSGYRDGGGGGGGDAGNEHLRANWPRPDEHPSRRRQRRPNRSNRSRQLCAICQDEMRTDGLPFKKLRCPHSFHNRCIEEWAQRKRECPVCRQVF